MSLAVAALRIATVKALAGATSAGSRVFDSDVDPVQLIGSQAIPTIVVYTDAGKRNLTGRELLGGDHVVDLVIEIFVAKASKVTVKSEDGQDGEAIEINYPATDAGFENILQRIDYEISTVLSGNSPWAEVWKNAVAGFADRDSEWDRGADAKNGARFNFLRVIYRLSILQEPIRGAEIESGGFWQKFLDLADADDDLDDIAKDWRALITTPNLPEWRRQMEAVGATYQEISGLGLAPLEDHQPNDMSGPALLTDVVLDPEGLEINVGSADPV